MHCDGLGDDPLFNCLPPGEFLVNRIPFEVVPPAAQSGR